MKLRAAQWATLGKSSAQTPCNLGMQMRAFVTLASVGQSIGFVRHCFKKPFWWSFRVVLSGTRGPGDTFYQSSCEVSLGAGVGHVECGMRSKAAPPGRKACEHAEKPHSSLKVVGRMCNMA